MKAFLWMWISETPMVCTWLDTERSWTPYAVKKKQTNKQTKKNNKKKSCEISWLLFEFQYAGIDAL